MEPIPPTREALEKLDRLGETGTQDALERVGRAILAVVPECVGLSLTLVEEDITLTLVASGPATPSLDAMQYLDGGPCVAAMDSSSVVELNQADPLDEERWSLFARASAAEGVQSSLSMPLLDDDALVGGINLYASTRDAFNGHRDEIAGIVGGWAPGAVRDADLSFSTRLSAVATPRLLADQADVDVAVGFIAAAQGVDTETARSRLRACAAGAGISEAEVARTVIRAHTR